MGQVMSGNRLEGQDKTFDLMRAKILMQRAIDFSKRKLTPYRHDLIAGYKRFGLQSDGNSWSSVKISNVLNQRLHRYIKNFDGEEFNRFLVRMRKYLLYCHLKEGEDVAGIWNVLALCRAEFRSLKEHRRQFSRAFTQMDLIKITMLATWIMQYASHTDYFALSPHVDKEEWIYARTVVYIERIIPESIVDYGDLQNVEEIVKAPFERIEKRIHIFGPAMFVNEILKEYRRTFNRKYQMFSASDVSVRKFLLLLGIKAATSLDTCQRKPRPSENLKQIIFRMSCALLNLYAVRTDNPFRFLFFDDPVKHFQEIVLHDTIYKDFQYPPDGMLVLLDFVLSANEERLIRNVGLTVSEFITITKAIIDEAYQQLDSSVEPSYRISPEKIMQRLQRKSISFEKVESYFSKLACHYPLNKDFDNPVDMIHVNSDSEWLIPEYPEANTYFLPLPSIDCFGLYDKVLSRMGDNGGFLGFGDEFEELVRRWMQEQFQTPVHTGRFAYNGQAFETDGVLIDGNHVILLECKTKPIRRDSRSGLIAQLLIDFANAYIYSQLQAYRCEAAFRTGKLVLYPKNTRDPDVVDGRVTPCAILTLPDNPQFIRISCTPSSFGTFNEPVVSSHILHAVAQYEFCTAVPELEINFAVLHDTREKLLSVWEDLDPYYIYDGNEDKFHNITFYSYFIPFPLLFILTERNRSRKKPLERLLTFSHSQSNSYDVFAIMDLIQGND